MAVVTKSDKCIDNHNAPLKTVLHLYRLVKYSYKCRYKHSFIFKTSHKITSNLHHNTSYVYRQIVIFKEAI